MALSAKLPLEALLPEPRSTAAGLPRGSRGHSIPCCSQEDVAMTVEKPKLPFPNRAWPMVGGRAATGEPSSQSGDPLDTPDNHDEMAIPFVPRPVSLTRVFPGL